MFEKTRRRPSTLVPLLRGVAKGEPTARLSRELNLDRKRLGALRQQLQNNLYETLPTDDSRGGSSRPTSCIRTQGGKGRKHPDPADPPRRRANKRRGRGTYDNDRPPIIGVVSRTTKTYRYWVVEHANRSTSRAIVEASIPPEGTLLFTDEGANCTGLHPRHATVSHGEGEWARDDDGDRRRGVHCNSCEGAGAALRTYLRPFRGVHKYFLAEYVATFETMLNAKRITPAVVQNRCFGDR